MESAVPIENMRDAPPGGGIPFLPLAEPVTRLQTVDPNLLLVAEELATLRILPRRERSVTESGSARAGITTTDS